MELVLRRNPFEQHHHQRRLQLAGVATLKWDCPDANGVERHSNAGMAGRESADLRCLER